MQRSTRTQNVLRSIRIPPNLRFRIPRDFESPWSLGEDSWDLIHLRMGYGSISSWQEMYHNVFRHVNMNASRDGGGKPSLIETQALATGKWSL
jgi:hypothetical protein